LSIISVKGDLYYGILATRDAHGLYEKYGFKKVVEKYMRKDSDCILYTGGKNNV